MDWLVRFTGKPAIALKLLLLGVIDFFGGLAAVSAFGGGSTQIGIALVLIILFVNYVYFVTKSVAIKFLAPGIIFLLAFVVIPIIYTIFMSGFKFQAGHIVSKDEAIIQIESRGLIAVQPPIDFDMTLGEIGGEPAALLRSMVDARVFLVTQSNSKELVEGTYGVDEWGVPNTYEGFDAYSGKELEKLGDSILSYQFRYSDTEYISPQFDTLAILVTQDLEYFPENDEFVSISTGKIYRDNGQGAFANIDKPNKTLSPGWRTSNFPDNFINLFSKPEIRDPFIGVFIWTITFAFLSVFTTFALGLLLAIALDKKIKGRAIYRSILILPYAIPSFMSILVWRGMFNREFGIINSVLLDFGLISESIGWFSEPWTARFVILLVNLWLGFPYMYLISSGALQAIPGELREAAAIDGATPIQAFTKIVLPLLLKILSPLLIASFAFNFNNFNIIYLLTAGGPVESLEGEIAGATDILISYAYKIAVSDPNVRDFGLASAISMFMFVIVGLLSIWSLRRTKSLEEF
jgi:arabinogalactan oligomer / maltooligosaccharide transport system permease protein